jgi:hypothetical protein
VNLVNRDPRPPAGETRGVFSGQQHRIPYQRGRPSGPKVYRILDLDLLNLAGPDRKNRKPGLLQKIELRLIGHVARLPILERLRPFEESYP